MNKLVVLLLVAVASQSLAMPAQVQQKNSILDLALETLGLNNVWEQIQGVGANLLATLTAELTSLLFAGQQIIDNARPILQQLVADLQDHAGNAVPIVQQAVAQLATVLSGGKNNRDFADFLASLDLASVWSTITSVGADLASQFTGELAEIVMAGQQLINQARPIVQQMIADLQIHASEARPIVAQAVSQLAQLLNNNRMQRNWFENIANIFGLDQVWDQIQSVSADLFGQLMNEFTQLLFAGQQAWDQATVIFNQLVEDLFAHTGDATSIVQQAVAQLGEVLGNNKKMQRNWLDNIIATFGLDQVWDQIQSVGANLVGQLMGELAQLLFAGQQAWAQATEIFSQLVADLTAHTNDAVPLVTQAIALLGEVLSNNRMQRNWFDNIVSLFGLDQVWGIIQSVGSDLYAQLLAELAQLVFAGQQAWSQATEIFGQLASDLIAHSNDAVPLITQAVAQIGEILGNNNQRNWLDNVIGMFGLDQVWDQIQSVGANLLGQLMGELAQLLFAGQQAWAQATEIFSQLVADLTAHTNDAVPLVTQAIALLGEVLSNNY